MSSDLASFTDILGDVEEIADSQPMSLVLSQDFVAESSNNKFEDISGPLVRIHETQVKTARPSKCAGQRGDFRSVEEIAEKYRNVFTYPYFNLVQSRVIDDALYSDKSMVVCAPTGSGKTVIFELVIVQLLMELEEKNYNDDFKIIYMAPVKALCTERLTEWYPKFTRLGLSCIEVTGDTDVDFSQLKLYRIIITTPEKWDMLTRRWRDHRSLVEVIKLFLIDEVHILNDETRGPVLEAVVSRMKTIELSAQSAHRIERLQKQYQGEGSSSEACKSSCPRIRFVAVSATVNNPEDVAAWLGTSDKPAVYYKFGDESRPVKLNRVVEGYPCPVGTNPFKFDIILNYKLWPVILKYHDGKPTLIFCNTRKSVMLTAETLSKELTVSFTPEQKATLTALASTIKTKKIQLLVLNGVGCHHAGLLYEERRNIEQAFRNRDLPILITTTTLAMGVNLPAHLVIIKNTQQYVNGAYQEYSISTILQMVGRAGRPQFDTEATAVIMTRLCDKPRYQVLVGGSEPLQSYLHKRLPENLNSEAALGTVNDVAQCVQWLRSTFLFVRAAKDPKWYLGLPPTAPTQQIFKKIEELCVKAMNMLSTAGLIRTDEASCIEPTDAGRLMSIYYLDLETMKLIMKIEGSESLERLLMLICESHELSDMHLRVDERRCLNTLNRNNAAATIRFPMKGKINSRQMKLNCIIQAVLGCLPIPDPSLNQEAMKVMRIAERVCRCLVAYVTRPDPVCSQLAIHTTVLNSLILLKCIKAHLWENSPYVSRQLKGIGPTFSTLLATAGKTTFPLLLESHPRDLERIMNKGPPAGNILRKQISLLPQYQIIMTPIDEKKVSIQLLLINQSFLAENQDNLTAGDSHSSHVLVGDSENHLLLLTHFNDKDLIGIYNGTIIYEISRKHTFEHKIFVSCISSKFGVCASEHIPNNWKWGESVAESIDFVNNICQIDKHDIIFLAELEPKLVTMGPEYSRDEDSVCPEINKIATKNPQKKQTNITDVYKYSKRKNDDEISQSKEKKRRDNAFLEEIKYLKESFNIAAKEIQEDSLSKTNSSNCDMIQIPTSYKKGNDIYEDKLQKATEEFDYMSYGDELNDFSEMNEEDFDTDNVIVDQHIDTILNDIENEISINRCKPATSKVCSSSNEDHQNINIENSINVTQTQSKAYSTISLPTHRNTKPTRKTFCPPKKKQNIKSNYSFIDSLSKKTAEKEQNNLNHSFFSDSIKDHIEKFLQKAKNKTKIPDTNIEHLVNHQLQNENINKESKPFNIIDLTTDISTLSNKNTLYVDISPNIEKIRNNYSNTMVKDQTTPTEPYLIDTHKSSRKENAIKKYPDSDVKEDENYSIQTNHKLNYMTEEASTWTDSFDLKKITNKKGITNNILSKYTDNPVEVITSENDKVKNCIVSNTDFNDKVTNSRNVSHTGNDFKIDADSLKQSEDVISNKHIYEVTKCDIIQNNNSMVAKLNIFNNNDSGNDSIEHFDMKSNLTTAKECNNCNFKYNLPTYITNKIIINTLTTEKSPGISVVTKEKNNNRELVTSSLTGNFMTINELHKQTNELQTTISRPTHKKYDLKELDNTDSNLSKEYNHCLIESNSNAVSKNITENIKKNTNDDSHTSTNQVARNIEFEDDGSIDRINFVNDSRFFVQKTSNLNNFDDTNTSALKYKLPIHTETGTYLNNDSVDKSLGKSLHALVEIPMTPIHLQGHNNTEKKCEELKANQNYYNENRIKNNLFSSPFAHNRINSDAESCSTNEYFNNMYNKNSHIKRFSFSTTKINVHVKDKTDHRVQIISKLKVNLDVTQIVSKLEVNNNDNMNSKNYNTANIEPESPNTYPTNELKQLDYNNTNASHQLNNGTGDIHNLNQIMDEKDLEAYTKAVEDNYNTSSNNFESFREIQKMNHVEVQNSLSKPNTCDISYQNRTMLNIAAIEDNNSNFEITNSYKTKQTHCLQNIKGNLHTTMNSRNNMEAKDSIPPSGHNIKNVKNILHKYSKIFAKGFSYTPVKDKPIQENEQLQEPENNFKSEMKPMIESLEANRKRPFKISELNNSQNKRTTKMPIKTINRTSFKENVDVINSSTTVNNINKTFTYVENLNKNKCSKNDFLKLITPTQDYNDDIPIFSSPDTNITDWPIDYDLPVDEIDNAMFNPKTLLQCCYKTESEEKIPPPVQFCDSHVPSMQPELNKANTCSDIMYNYSELDIDNNNTSIFEHNNSEQLTPTKEIETWTLSCDDYDYEANIVKTSPLKSCTVIRKVSPGYINSISRYNPNKRDKKLSVFKFKPKDKMKLN